MEYPVYGPQIGSYLGRPIYKTIESEGTKLQFVRKATCDSDGCPLDQLQSDEIMMKPGLIYKKVA